MARTASGKAGQPRDLVRMRQRLDEWRRGNARGVGFPEQLWTAAGRLARRHGVYVTARLLGLEYNKLKRASAGMFTPSGGVAKKRSIATPVKFIELTGALPASASGCRLSLQGPTGERLRMEMAPSAATEMVLQLCRSGWASSP